MTQRLYASLIFLVALSVILSAWAFELIGGFQPCGLCLQQRIPYYICLLYTSPSPRDS